MPIRLPWALHLLLALAPLSAQQTVPDAAAPPPPPGWQRFYSLDHAFRVDLPAGWRQLAPGEVAAVHAALHDLPPEFERTEPRLFYVLGPVDQWLAGTFDGVFAYVVQQDNEWQTEDEPAAQLAARWRESGATDGRHHEVEQVQRRSLGGSDEVVTCLRSTTPAAGAGPTWRSLDVHAATGGREVSVSFRCRLPDFPAHAQEFERILATMVFALPAKGRVKLRDRLWTPLLTGAIVGVLLVILYKRGRRAV